MIRSFIQEHCKEFVTKAIYKVLYASFHVHGPKEKLFIGENVSLANTLFNTRSGSITVGDNCIFGHNVMVLTGYHDVQMKGSELKRKTLVDANLNIVIEEGVWVGSGAIILGSVRIGKNSVIGAGSIVTKDIPTGVLAVGNPATPKKKISFYGE